MKKNVRVMIPGPTPVVEPIRYEMGREIQAFGDPRFVKDYKTLIDNLSRVFNCSGKTFPLAGTGTLAMEMAISNTTRKGDKVLVVTNGFFGDRFIEICERKGLQVDTIAAEWGKVVSPEQIEAKLEESDYAVITISHVDTATGAVAPIQAIGNVVKKFPNTLLIVDGVAATGGEYVDIDGMNIDILFTGSQKAFGVCPGMFILWAGSRALSRRKTLGLIPEYYIDFEKWIPIMDDPTKYFATPAINLIWAMSKSLDIIMEEGLENRYKRHKRLAEAVQGAFESIGFGILADPENRAVTLSNILYPEGVDDKKFRALLLEHGVIVAGGLANYAGKMFRLGHMGNIDDQDLAAVLYEIENVLEEMAYPFEKGMLLKTYSQNLKQNI